MWLRCNSDSPSTIRPSSVRHTQEVGVRTSSTSIYGAGKASSFKTTGNWSWSWDRYCKSLQWLLVFQYLGVVVSASFEIFVYKSNLQISLKPRWRSWCFPCLFLWMLFSRNRNTDFKHRLLLWLKLLNSALQTQTLSMLVRHVADVFCEVTIPKNNPEDFFFYLLMEQCLSWLKSLCFLFFSSFLWSFSEELCFASCPSLLSLSSRLFESFSRSFVLSFSALLKWPGWWTNTVNISTCKDDLQGAVMHLVESSTTDQRLAEFS